MNVCDLIPDRLKFVMSKDNYIFCVSKNHSSLFCVLSLRLDDEGDIHIDMIQDSTIITPLFLKYGKELCEKI